jgi:hypothetical protein
MAPRPLVTRIAPALRPALVVVALLLLVVAGFAIPVDGWNVVAGLVVAALSLLAVEHWVGTE